VPTTTIEIDGSPINMAAANLWPTRMSLTLRGISTLSLIGNGVKLQAAPDPWLLKPIVLKVDGVPAFAGDVVDRKLEMTELGWTAVYQCRDLRARGDRVALVDSNTLGNEARWNFDPEDEDKIDARLGRTVGQILADALTMDQNAAALDGKGIGGYTSLSPPTLPAETAADLAAMTMIPPAPVSIGGERLLGAVDAFLRAWAPNHAMWVRPDGVIRFLDLRAVSELVLTLDDCGDRVMPPALSRSLSDCFTRAVVYGRSVAEGKLLSLSAGTLEEFFAYGSLDNAAAKAAYKDSDFSEDQAARSQGSVSVTDLTHVVVTSDPTTQAWGANEWDQTNRQGRVYLTDTAGSGINYMVSSRIVANTANASGGTSTFTLETALPGTDFDTYVLYGISSGASLVYRKYRATDPDIRDALARRMTYPVPYVLAGGGAATMTSYPMGSVCWSTTGAPPYNEFSIPMTVDPSDGTFTFSAPTRKMAGKEPDDVRILAAVNVQTLTATVPASGYEGTAHTVDGMEDTMPIYLREWRDPANLANVLAFAQDQLDSVKDAIVEGSVTLQRLYTPALGFGVGLSIEGARYETGWEGVNLPVVQVDVSWNSRGASSHTTTLQVSNRRANYAATAFLQPERRAGEGIAGGFDFSTGGGFSGPMGGGYGLAGGMGGGYGMGGYGADGFGLDGGASGAGASSPFGTGGMDGGGMATEAPGGFGGGDDFVAMADMMGPVPTSAKDPRSRYDRTPARDATSPRDPRPARDSTPAGERPYKPGRKYTTPGKYSVARKFDAPDRKAESAARAKASAGRRAQVDQRRQANAAKGRAAQERQAAARQRPDQQRERIERRSGLQERSAPIHDANRWVNQADPEAALGQSSAATASRRQEGDRDRAELQKRKATDEKVGEIRDAQGWINQADPDAMRRQSPDTTKADQQRSDVARRAAEQKARDDADGGQDWRDAP